MAAQNQPVSGPLDPVVAQLRTAITAMSGLTGTQAAIDLVTGALSNAVAGCQAANQQLNQDVQDLAAANAATTSCQTALTAANSKLAAVPVGANGQPAKPGTYVSMQALGVVAVGVGLLGALGGYWYKGTTLKKPKALGAKEEEAAEEASK